MAQSKITLIGIENYLNPERSIFDKLTLPDGIDKETLIGSIVLRCQEFELLYTDPDFLTDAVNIWSRKNYWTFNRWVKAINVEYNPLYNFDRTEEVTENHTGSNNKTINGTNNSTNNETSDYTRTDNLTQSDDHTRTDNLSQSDDHTRTDNLTETMTHSEKAYNSGATMVDTTKDVDGKTGTQRMAGTSNNTGTQRTAGTTTDTGTQRNAGSTNSSINGSFNSGETGSDTANNTRYARMFGNIGVTTSQRMLESELDIARWNLYEHIADLFCQEFCIMVY